MENLLFNIIKILILAFVQNVSFSIVSRSRNRDNKKYHIIAAFFSNSIWFFTFRELILANMNLLLFLPYVVGTILGSVSGMKVSMWIEKKLGATADGHIKPKETTPLTKKMVQDIVGNMMPEHFRSQMINWNL